MDADPRPVRTAALRAPPVLSPAMIAAAIFLLFVLASSWATADRTALITTPIAIALLILLVRLQSKASRDIGERSLALFADRLLLPVSIRDPQLLSVPLREVTGLVVLEGAAQGQLVIGTKLMDFRYPLRAFRDADEARGFLTAIRARIEDMPLADRTVQAMEAEERRAGRALAARPWMVVATCALLVIAHGLLFANALGEDSLGSLVFAGSSRSLVAAGEPFRVFAYSLTHSPWWLPAELGGEELIRAPSGLLLLGLSLIVATGLRVERLLGALPTGLLLWGSALFGGLLNLALRRDHVVEGMGAMVFSILGAYLYLGFQKQGALPIGFRGRFRLSLFALFLIVLLGMQPEVGLELAFGGMIFGVVTTALAFDAGLPLERPPLGMKAIGAALLVLHVGGFGWALARSDAHTEADWRRVIDGTRDAQRLNVFAWTVATRDGASTERLRTAELAAEAAVALSSDPQRLAADDTLATVRFRQGEYARAVELQLDVLRRAESESLPSGVFASQLARFALPVADTSSVAPELSVRVVEDGRVEVSAAFEAAPEERVTVYALVDDANDEHIAVVRATFGEELGTSILLDTPEEISIPENTTVRVLLMRAGPDQPRVWSFDPRVAAFPI